MALTTGTNTLAVYADHPSGFFTTNKSSGFTVPAGAVDVEQSQYDGAGNVTNRVWKNASGQIVKMQTLTWDAFGRLVKVTERDAGTNGFNFVSVFDGLGRQIQTTETTVTNNVLLASNPAPVVVSFTYDPQVEFLAIGIGVSQGNVSRQDWLTYGLDVSGRYGGMQGVGGLETITTVSAAGNMTATILNDCFGNVLGAVTNGAVAWNSSRLNLYAPVEGYAPPRLSLSVPTYASLAWRTRPLNAAGLVQLGARTYDPMRRAFLSADPFGHSSDPALNTAFNQNPAFYFDPSGRCVDSVIDAAAAFTEHTVDAAGILANNTAGALDYALTSPFMPNWAYQTYGNYAQGFANNVNGVAQTTYDVAALATYGLASPLFPNFAYNNYGGSVQNIMGQAPSFYGGNDQPLPYQLTYGALNTAMLFMGGEAGEVGNLGKVGEISDAASGSINLMRSSDQFLINAANRTGIDANGFLDVVAHGNSDFVEVGGQLVDHRALSQIINNNSQFVGQDIRLLSCSTGELPNGFAQNLANKLGVNVTAPNDTLWAFPNGKFTVGPTPNVNSGSWINFVPGGNR